MKTPLVLWALPSLVVILVSSCATRYSDAGVQSHTAGVQPDTDASKSALRTGTYVCDTFKIALRFDSSGGYEVKSDTLEHHTEELGKWTWNEQRREFLLERTSGDFQFVRRRLRVDECVPDQLRWIIPLSRDDFEGTIDYVSFKRQKQND